MYYSTTRDLSLKSYIHMDPTKIASEIEKNMLTSEYP